MLVDVLSSDNYLYVNVGAVKILGLNNAIYCSELLRIYRKATKKKKIDDKGFFKVDRTYLKSRTSLSFEEQVECESSLSRINLVTINKDYLDTIKFDDKLYMSIITQEDSKFLNELAKKVRTSKQTAKEVKRDRIILALKDNISNADEDIHTALEKWIDTLFINSKVLMTKETIAEFENSLVSYCGTDKKKALRLIEIATSQSWKNCLWEIKAYEQEQSLSKKNLNKRLSTSNVASNDDVGDIVF